MFTGWVCGVRVCSVCLCGDGESWCGIGEEIGGGWVRVWGCGVCGGTMSVDMEWGVEGAVPEVREGD